MNLRRGFQKLLRRFLGIAELEQRLEHIQMALGRVELRQTSSATLLAESEFKAFSQMGEDGIIQFLVRHVPIKNKVFVELGVQDYRESNTRFLLKQGQWKGLVIDRDAESVDFIRRDEISWQYDLTAICAFITAENINQLLQENGFVGEIGLLSIDIDGNDYWIWNAISVVLPAIVVVEYNFRFGAHRAVTIPYKPDFARLAAHPSGIYFGASLNALYRLAQKKGYALVGCSSAGTNAFFVRRDLKPDILPERSANEAFVKGCYRLSRDASGAPIALSPEEEEKILTSLPLVEID
ncbi:MAG: hypothetical protein NZM05_03340 [Chloroherpetonaceae bacterium]|nr:hypothetical protein [Chloroherpetonaceae bacterium]